MAFCDIPALSYHEVAHAPQASQAPARPAGAAPTRRRKAACSRRPLELAAFRPPAEGPCGRRLVLVSVLVSPIGRVAIVTVALAVTWLLSASVPTYVAAVEGAHCGGKGV